MKALLEKKWTWEEFRNMEFNDTEHYIYELINGTIGKRTSPNLIHQRIFHSMTIFLESFLLILENGEGTAVSTVIPGFTLEITQLFD